MKRLLIVILLCYVAIVSCTKNQLGVTLVNESPASLNKPLDDALADMNAFWSMVYKNGPEATKATLPPTVENINICSLPKTKESAEDTETSVYLVNFINNSGYAVLNGNYNGPAVIAFIEQGSIDAEKLNSVLASATRDYELFSQMDEESFEDSNDYVYHLLADLITASSSEEHEEMGTKAVSSDFPYQVVEHLPPLVNCKWEQTYPFNQYMPYYPNAQYTSKYRQRAPVGCAIVAVAQMMTKTNHPAFSQFSGNSYSWSDFSSVSNYNNAYQYRYYSYDNYVTNDIQTKMYALCQGLFFLSVPFNPTYGPTGTGVNPNNLISGLLNLDSSYYANATAQSVNWHVWDIIDMLSDGKPTIAYGQSTIKGGADHAWLIDGYLRYEESYGLTRTCLHFNWGFQKINDGYFAINTTYEMDDRIAYETGYDMSYTTSTNSTYGSVYYIDY